MSTRICVISKMPGTRKHAKRISVKVLSYGFVTEQAKKRKKQYLENANQTSLSGWTMKSNWLFCFFLKDLFWDIFLPLFGRLQ